MSTCDGFENGKGVGVRLTLVSALTTGALVLAGCGSGRGPNLDWDLRPSGRFSTAEAARARPAGARPPMRAG